LSTYGDQAKTDKRLADEHRSFVNEIETDEKHYPMWRGKYAGIGGVYTIKKPSAASN